ncbi:MAG TPA: PSD1 and planctomycete cytochrome C domain-containing protein [Gemmataceae bacterium]
MSRVRNLRAVLTAGLLALPAAAPARAEGAGGGPPVDYTRDVRPILVENCYACHGPDAKQRKAGLRLDVRGGAVASAVRPGDPAGSPLVERVTSDDPAFRMPPPRSKKPPLTAEQVAVLQRWIEQGAEYDVHWAYVPPKRPPLPAAGDTSWARNPIDRFVAAGHERHGLTPAPGADRRTLIRRLSFDLTGLPPSPAEVDAFARDTDPKAYEKLVERLLASEHFGERMAMYWLDLVRYTDTGGYHSDNHRDVAPYRDYVIDAFNANKPFDRFTLEQIAGDLLPQGGRAALVASGYNRLLQTTEEGGAQPKEYTAKYFADRVRNASSVWLGTTLGCAECHDHKYDPFTQKDFYSFGAFFADVKEKPVGRQEQTPLPDPRQQKALDALDARLAALRPAAAKSWPGPALVRAAAQVRLNRTEGEKKALLATIPHTLVTVSVPPRTVRILPRGNWLDDSGPVVTPGTPGALPPVKVDGRRANRLDLARWLVRRDNPLTARVMVNRLWRLMFGEGLVRTPDDFGTQGAPPTHPELLDWLAVEFMDSGWDVKHMLRLMALSATYQQSSERGARSEELGTEEAFSVPSSSLRAPRSEDPENLWLARQNRFRLDAEVIRDGALKVSGLLNPAVGGPSVKPYQPAGYWAYLNFPKREWEPSSGPDQYRRGLYTYWCRTFLHPSLAAFDAPTREECTVARPRSSTPLQALVLLNDPTYVEAARALAARVVREGGETVPRRIAFAFREVLARAPREAEAEVLAALLEKHLAEYRADPGASRRLLGVGQAPAPPGLDAAELAAWTSVARVLFNLHEAVTRY